MLREGETATATVSLEMNISAVDVLFLLDSTGTMRGEIEEIRTCFDEIADIVDAVVPDSAFGVAQFHDYGLIPYGNPDDFPFRLEQQITSDRAPVYTALEPNGRVWRLGRTGVAV